MMEVDWILEWLKSNLDINVKEATEITALERAISMVKDVSLVYFDNPEEPRDPQSKEV